MKTRFSILLFILALNSSKAQDVFITRPYLQIGQNPSPQSLELLWHAADLDANWQVEHRNTIKDPWVRSLPAIFTRVAVTGIEAHRVYHAALTGLVPGSIFSYRILKEGKTVFISEAQASKTPDQPYRFVAMGDIGAETTDQKKLALQAWLQKPDFLEIGRAHV